MALCDGGIALCLPEAHAFHFVTCTRMSACTCERCVTLFVFVNHDSNRLERHRVIPATGKYIYIYIYIGRGREKVSGEFWPLHNAVICENVPLVRNIEIRLVNKLDSDSMRI